MIELNPAALTTPELNSHVKALKCSLKNMVENPTGDYTEVDRLAKGMRVLRDMIEELEEREKQAELERVPGLE